MGTETGADALNLTVSEITTDSLQGVAGVWLSRTYKSHRGMDVTPELRLRYLHEFQDTNRAAVVALAGAPGTPFTVAGVRPRRDSALVGLAVVSQMSDRLHGFASYDGQFDSRQDVHSGEMGLRFAW